MRTGCYALLRRRWWLACPWACSLLWVICPQATQAQAPKQSTVPEAHQTQGAVSLMEYRARLEMLDQLVATCQASMTLANCRSEAVGPDVQVALPLGPRQGPRQIRLEWLRDLLNQAAAYQAKLDAAAITQEIKPEQMPGSGALPDNLTESRAGSGPGNAPGGIDRGSVASNPPTPPFIRGGGAPAGQGFAPPPLPQRLADARKRLKDDWQWAGEAGGEIPTIFPSSSPSPAAEHGKLQAILSEKEYRASLTGPTLRDQVLETLGRWIDDVIGVLQDAGARSKWIGVAAEAGFGGVICVALAWFLIRLERQGRLRPAGIHDPAGAGEASARDWQLLLEEARAAAAKGAWRDALHLVYWASITRLESSGRWPSDQARTPRQYLALFGQQKGQESGQRLALLALTRSFERTWYAGNPASEADFRQAERLAASVMGSASLASDKGAQ